MSHKQEKFYLIYILWLLVFTLLTNEYYDFNGILSINQNDSISYMNIANSAPHYSLENITFHRAQRFFFPYIIGIVSNIFNIEVFTCFKIFTLVVLFIIVIAHFYIINKLKCEIYISIISISLLILNPYIFRYLIAVPTMLNDAIFLLSLYIFSIGLILNNKTALLGIFFSLTSRQNGISLFFGYLIKKVLENKNKFFKDKNLIASIIMIVIVTLIANNYAKNVSTSGFAFSHINGIFYWIKNNWDLKDLIYWLILPLYSYLPALFIILTSRKIVGFSRNYIKQNIVLFFIFFSIIGISYIPGPEMSGRHIIRHTTLAYPVLLIWMSWFTQSKKKFYNIYSITLVIIILHIWSFHPRYSKISAFEFLRELLI